MKGSWQTQLLDSAIANLEKESITSNSEAEANKTIKVIQGIEKHIGDILPINFELNKPDLNHLKELRDRICKISEVSLKNNANQSINKYCQQALKNFNIIINYCDTDTIDAYKKESFRVKILNSVRSGVIACNVNWNQIKKDPFIHPEWLEFKNSFADYLTENETKYLWKKLIEIIIQITDHTENDIPKSTEFDEIINILSTKGLLTVNKDTQGVALWSGGHDVSLFVRKNGFTTIENTIAGSIFNKLILTGEKKPIFLLWNALSNKYVENINEDVHIFFRVHDPLSILEKIEIPRLLAKKNINLIFHPLYNTTNEHNFLAMEELKIHSSKKPYITLKNFLVKVCKQQLKIDNNYYLYEKNLLAINTMKLD